MNFSRRETLKILGAGAVAAGLGPIAKPVYALTKRDLFDPVKIGTLKLKNRIIRSSTSMEMADENGMPTPQLLKVYEQVAEGGASLIITGLAYINKQDQPFHAALGFYDDAQIPAFKTLAQKMQKNGAKACLQIGYAGSMSGYKVKEREIWGPSAIPHPFTKVTPKAMTKEDIQQAVKEMAQAAARAQKAGFDAVELHFVHNFMLNQFLVPHFNKRTDEYGGSIENRARIIFEITEAVRMAVGEDYPVVAKIHGQDYLEREGMTLDEGIYVAKGLAKRGVTALDISGGNLMSAPENLPIRPEISDDTSLQSYFAKDAQAIDRALDIPMILTGGNRDTKVMQQVMDINPDVVAFGLCRTILSEPDLPNQWAKDKSVEPACISCNECLMRYGNQPTVCVLNE
ncbi:MAG: NADH:flavin oxidoreductase [Desulfobacterales bacterium]|nr:NADH:flavin oxidoreductase [Desulfobacterales bacterium]